MWFLRSRCLWFITMNCMVEHHLRQSVQSEYSSAFILSESKWTWALSFCWSRNDLERIHFVGVRGSLQSTQPKKSMHLSVVHSHGHPPCIHNVHHTPNNRLLGPGKNGPRCVLNHFPNHVFHFAETPFKPSDSAAHSRSLSRCTMTWAYMKWRIFGQRALCPLFFPWKADIQLWFIGTALRVQRTGYDRQATSLNRSWQRNNGTCRSDRLG